MHSIEGEKEAQRINLKKKKSKEVLDLNIK
jgi:hypothetical protein